MNKPEFTVQQFQDIIARLDGIEKKVGSPQPQLEWIDNSQFLRLLNISRRTGQHYRDSNLIGYSMIGNRIWYRLTEVRELIERHYRKRLT
jgi:hypothetical protein